MFDTSQDILNIAKTVAVIGLSVIFAWLIFYLVMITRQVFKIIKEARDKINKIDEIIKTLKTKIEHSTSYLLLISEGVKKVIEIAKDHTSDTSKKSKKAKKDKK